jgi:hypothetical protein
LNYEKHVVVSRLLISGPCKASRGGFSRLVFGRAQFTLAGSFMKIT